MTGCCRCCIADPRSREAGLPVTTQEEREGERERETCVGRETGKQRQRKSGRARGGVVPSESSSRDCWVTAARMRETSAGQNKGRETCDPRHEFLSLSASVVARRELKGSHRHLYDRLQGQARTMSPVALLGDKEDRRTRGARGEREPGCESLQEESALTEGRE